MFKYSIITSILLSVSITASAKSRFTEYGDIASLALPAIAAGLSWQQDDNEGLIQFGEGYVATMATSEALKFSIHAKRPNGEDHSFPSAHTASAFSAASYLQQRYGWKYGVPAYTAAAAVGWSRVNAKEHYWRDVIAGAAIATGFSYVFTTPQDKKLAIAPTIFSDSSPGILVSYNL
ncbi:phosphatase PAP2 family protein [Tolumonas lignilytica]|uniref:phosphatase PAP2 family protein n=1 Tax=Tolumonas lignilytica TaxID=1283284 RepID=UPI000467AB46|nr:phosphatase PAP2 family protein [Tolumonas lignilytica]